MRTTVVLALTLAFALTLAGCASPARESSRPSDADDGTGECSGNVCRDTLEVTGPNETANETNASV